MDPKKLKPESIAAQALGWVDEKTAVATPFVVFGAVLMLLSSSIGLGSALEVVGRFPERRGSR